MRRIGTATAATALAVLLGFVLRAPARAACCFEQCGWIACGINECPPSGECPGPLGSVIFFDADATCGEGDFSRCPPTEVGQCTDGVNNDFLDR